MAEDFKAGDLVQLKSGGPTMTVSGKAAFGSGFVCDWFVGTENKRATFSSESLKRVSDDEDVAIGSAAPPSS